MTDIAAKPAAFPPGPAGGSAAAPWQARTQADYLKLFLGFGGMVIGQFMAILDIQIVAASLSQIQAGVGASADEIAWVQTIYLLAEVVIMPLTAYMTRLWGTRPTFMVCCAAFIVTSVMTGLSTSIDMMIITRALQGLAAGAMIPAVFATAFTAFPPERRMTANVIVSVIVTLAPTIGPTLGGHITEALSWRWLFFINVPPGLVVLFLVGRYGDFDKGDPSLAKGVDWWGVGLMAIALLSIQWVLEEGAGDSWFQDDIILWLTVLGVITLAAFIWRQLTYKQPIINLRPFSDRNFSLGIMMTLVAGVSLFGGTFIIPLFLAQVRGYSAAQVGSTMFISGATMMITGPTVGRFVRTIDPRIGIVTGFGLAAYGVGLGRYVTDAWGFWEFAGLQALRGVGVMIAMISSQSMTVSTMKPQLMKDASAIVNLVRNVGGAVGLAFLSTVIGVQQRAHLTDISSAMSITNPRSVALLSDMQGFMAGSFDPIGGGYKAVASMAGKQALVLAFGDAFFWLAAFSAVAAVLAIFARPSKGIAAKTGSH
ncbi:DHA2 family efflux MFS transporter permease subunit [soil metagenome]